MPLALDSIFFISCFLPVMLVLYGIIPTLKWKNLFLLVIGLCFYAFGGITAIGLLLLSGLWNYAIGLLLRKNKWRKCVLGIGVGFNLIYLVAFKYLTFILNGVLGLPDVSLGIAVPLGMSFFIFKGISYIIDAYRDSSVATARLDKFFLYLSFFPQVTAGPISRFAHFSHQLESRSLSTCCVAGGIRRFIIGLSKKVLICSVVGNAVDIVFSLSPEMLDMRLAWLGALGYLLQIYFDFSGYSDMAIGLGMMLGFETPENFAYPYTAGSIGDFWRKWHISLSSWFKDYVYIPLGGNRKGKIRTACNKIIVFALCGLWHGANWTFVLWGLWHGLFSALESTNAIPIKAMNKRNWGRICAHIYTMLVVGMGFVIFRAESVVQGLQIVQAMFTGFYFETAATVALYSVFNMETICLYIIGVLCVFPIGKFFLPKLKQFKWFEPVSYVACMILLLLCVLKVASGGFSPFIYAQF